MPCHRRRCPPMKQISFANAEFAAKKRVTRRERFLAETEQVVPWPALLAALAPLLSWGGGTARARTDRPVAHIAPLIPAAILFISR